MKITSLRLAPRAAGSHFAHSRIKHSKPRMSFQEALERDRMRVNQLKSLPIQERLKTWRAFPWKFFICFMVIWSYAGTHVVPYMKEGNIKRTPEVLPSETSGVRTGRSGG